MNNPIIITGGTQRLGLAMALNLLDQGHELIISYRTKKPSCERLQQLGAKLIQADFANQQGIEDFVQQVRKASQSVRAIIHNASDWAAEGSDVAPAVLMERMMQIHVQAPYQINLALESHLLASEAGADIIHMTDYVQDTGSKKHLAYAASKAALHNLTLSFATRFAPQVKVNSIAPALLMFNEDDSEEYKAKALKKSLLEICPGAQEAVDGMNYLLNSSYITGRTLHLDGGRHLK